MMPSIEFQGHNVSGLGLGCSNFGKRIGASQAASVVHAALDNGVNFFDVADVYGDGEAEVYLGAALLGHRDQVVLATKFGHAQRRDGAVDSGGHPKNVRRCAEESLRRLGTDWIDLFQLHEPDPRVPVSETLGALGELITEGKVRWAGCSNVGVTELSDAARAVDECGYPGFVTVQNEYSLLVRDAETEVLPYCREHGLRFLPFFPLASGVLTGKYRMDERIPPGTRVARMKPDKLFRFFTPRALNLVEEMVRLGREYGRDPITYAFAFLLAEPAVLSVISGAMTPEQVAENAKAAATPVTDAELTALRQVSAAGEQPA